MPTTERGFAVLAALVAALFVVSSLFAGLALLLRLHNDRHERIEARLRARWEPLMLEVLAGMAPDAALSGAVAPQENRYFLSFLVGYARRLRGDERATVRRLAAPLLPALTRSLGRGNSEKRGLTVYRLAEIGLPEYADDVALALEDRSPGVAIIAARGLFREGLERFFPAVLVQLPRLAHHSRSFLSSMLAQGGPGAAPPLRGILADPFRQPPVRAIAADALTSLRDLPAVPIAIELLRPDEDRELVTACLRLIRRLGHHEHVPAVRPFAASTDALVRAAAVGALGAIGGSADIRVLQEALADEHYWVSLEAARGLMALGDVETLRRLAASDGPWAVLARQVLSE